MKKVLITGATGFVGRNLCAQLESKEGLYLNKAVRKKTSGKQQGFFEFGDFSGETDFSRALENVDSVIHLAAVAHVKNESSGTLNEQMRRCNIDASVKLMKQAIAFGVRRFVFLSSIGVNGSSNVAPFSHGDLEKPEDSYAMSKFEAEKELQKLSINSSIELTIVRPPLVYGSGAPGNFGMLLKLAKKNIPLPFGAINNQRSFVAIDNLVNFLVICLDHPKAKGETFFISDDKFVTTAELMRALTRAAGKTPLLFPCPIGLLRFAAAILGRKAAMEKFTGSLTVDLSYTKKTLGWKPVISFDEGIRRCFK